MTYRIRIPDLAEALDVDEAELLGLQDDGFEVVDGDLVVDDSNADRFERLTGLHCTNCMGVF